MSNKELVVAVLRDLANKIELIENGPTVKYKKAAYLKAAKSLQNFNGDFKNASQVKDLPGIGESIYKKIDELLTTGKLTKIEKFDKGNTNYLDLLKINGVGSLKAKAIYKTYKVKTIAQLYDKIQKGKIIDEKLKRNVERALAINGRRMDHKEAMELANQVSFPLNLEVPQANIVVCGSVRRKTESSGDIDIVVGGTQDLLEKSREIVLKQKWDNVEMAGDKKISVVKNGIGIDFRFVDRKCLGAMVLTQTGSADFNIKMRTLAKNKGYLLNEYGLFKGKKLLASETEKDIFDALNLEFVEPENRA